MSLITYLALILLIHFTKRVWIRLKISTRASTAPLVSVSLTTVWVFPVLMVWSKHQLSAIRLKRFLICYGKLSQRLQEKL